MNYKKKSLILSIFLIIIIQILLIVNNRQKTNFRYFIWNIQDVSIGRLICFSFISGLLISSILNKSIHNNIGIYPENEELDKKTTKHDTSINLDDNNESFEMPPERDLRDTQPTISVNYRIIKENAENELKDKNQRSRNTEYQDDWNNKESEW